MNFETGSADSMSSWFLKRGWVAATQNWQVKDMAIIIEIKSEIGRGGMTADNFALPAGGIRRPHLRRLTHWGRRRCGSAWSLSDIPSPQTPLRVYDFKIFENIEHYKLIMR